MRYAYAITTALLLGGTAATFALQSPSNAQTAQNEPGTIALAAPPRAGAPMSFADLAAKLQPAVVNISTTQRVEVSQRSNPFAGTPFEDFGGGQPPSGGRPTTREGQSLGSGFIISDDGYIVTNNHVISAGDNPNDNSTVTSITVTMSDRTEYNATLVGRDPASDLAVLKINAKNLPFVKFGDSTSARVGDWVVAIGNPFGLEGTVTAGIVSAVHRNTGQGGAYDRYIQTDASINRGNSGGPMFDLSGNVIGINTLIFSPTGGNVGIGFAIPAEQAWPIVQTLKGGSRVKRGYLGIGLIPMNPEIYESLNLKKGRGELVARVEPNEGADKAGIRQGDVILKINNRDVTQDETLSFIVSGLTIGSRVPIVIIRGGKQTTLIATIGERPEEQKLALSSERDKDLTPEGANIGGTVAREALGVDLIPLTTKLVRQLGLSPDIKGVVITSVDPAADAAAKGLQRGDVILSINQRQTATLEEVSMAIKSTKEDGRKNALLNIFRSATGNSSFLAIKIR